MNMTDSLINLLTRVRSLRNPPLRAGSLRVDVEGTTCRRVGVKGWTSGRVDVSVRAEETGACTAVEARAP
jgi:hypothetical protein